VCLCLAFCCSLRKNEVIVCATEARQQREGLVADAVAVPVEAGE